MADQLTVAGVPVYRDSAGHLFENPSDAQIQELGLQMASKADISAIPQPATTTPKTELTGGAVGAQPTRFAREDHQHPRLTSTTYATLDGTGQATVVFSRTFVNKPGLNLTETDASTGTQPLVLRGLAWQRDGNGLYTGVTMQGQRAQMLPTITPISGVITLISGLITGINTVLAQLTGYNVFGGNASGATVSVIAIARSDVSST